MNGIAEITFDDGEILSITETVSRKELEFKILNNLDFENIRSFFIKKTIIDVVKERHKKSNGSNGITTVELLDIFKWKEIESYVQELVDKKIIEKKKGINLEMYFIYKK